MSSPTWYDLLDVEPTASTERIRAAWKDAIADLDPTDRRFQRLSEAAAVLLDPDRRAAYDDSLGESVAGAGPQAADNDAVLSGRVSGGGPQRGVVSDEDGPVPTRRPARRSRWARAKRRVSPDDLPGGTAASSVGDLPEAEPGISDIEPASVQVEHDPEIPATTGPARRQVPLWLLAALAVLALALVAVAAFAWARPDPKTIESGAAAARTAAERAVVPVLSYDYRSLEAGEKEAEARLTPRYRDKAYRPLFATIKQNAPATRTVVATKVVGSAIVRAGEDRVEVLLLVDRPTTNTKQATPITYEDHVTVTMERAADGWLIDDMTT